VSRLTEQRVILDRERFEDIFKFVMKAVREGIPEDEIWATVEVMSSVELESSIRESEREIREGRSRRFRTANAKVHEELLKEGYVKSSKELRRMSKEWASAETPWPK
jgi:hypothetical protein